MCSQSGVHTGSQTCAWSSQHSTWCKHTPTESCAMRHVLAHTHTHARTHARTHGALLAAFQHSSLQPAFRQQSEKPGSSREPQPTDVQGHVQPGSKVYSKPSRAVPTPGCALCSHPHEDGDPIQPSAPTLSSFLQGSSGWRTPLTQSQALFPPEPPLLFQVDTPFYPIYPSLASVSSQK